MEGVCSGFLEELRFAVGSLLDIDKTDIAKTASAILRSYQDLGPTTGRATIAKEYFVKQDLKGLFVLVTCIIWALSSGCALNINHVLAPGADQVQIVRNPADVARCTPVGNVDSRGGDVRNLTVGFGGNTLFVLDEGMGIVARGIAYRCPK